MLLPMKVKVLVLAAVWIAWSGAPIVGAEQYRFCVAEGLEALGNEKVPPSMERLRGRRLMMLIGIEGTRWRWVLNGCPGTKRCEFRIDDRGGAPDSVDPDQDPAAFTQQRDLGLMRIDAKRFRLRCLRELCVITHRTVGAKERERIRLLRGEWIELSAECEIDVKFSAD